MLNQPKRLPQFKAIKPYASKHHRCKVLIEATDPIAAHVVPGYDEKELNLGFESCSDSDVSCGHDISGKSGLVDIPPNEKLSQRDPNQDFWVIFRFLWAIFGSGGA